MAAGDVDLVLEDVKYVEPATDTVGPTYRMKLRNLGARAAGKFRIGAFAERDGKLSDDAPKVVTEIASLPAGEVSEVTLRLPVSGGPLRQQLLGRAGGIRSVARGRGPGQLDCRVRQEQQRGQPGTHRAGGSRQIGRRMISISSRRAPVALLFALSLVGDACVADFARAQQTQNAVFTMQADGSDVRKVIQVEGCYDHSGPRWSHDGKWLTFHAARTGGGGRRVFVVRTDGSELREIAAGTSPDWSPDDKQLVYQEAPSGQNPNICVQNLDGQGREIVTSWIFSALVARRFANGDFGSSRRAIARSDQRR